MTTDAYPTVGRRHASPFLPHFVFDAFRVRAGERGISAI